MLMLKVDKLHKNFGGLKAVTNVNININEGELVGLIGPNGAGKTTIFNMFTGVYVPTSGIIEFADESGNLKVLCGIKPNIIAERGISRTFQNIRLFKDISVLDNLRISMHKSIQHGLLDALFRLPRYRKDEKNIYEKSMELLNFVGLSENKENKARNLSYGEQRKLEIARSIATGARMIFLDEPAAGMNPSETDELGQLILKLQEKYNLTIMLIDHDMKFVMKLCKRIYVLDFGAVIAEGSPEEIKENKRVIAAYLGENRQ